jgi:O-antigen/teichoic acid export membrane protein
LNIKIQTLWNLLPLVLIAVVNIVSVPIFYRFLGEADYALWFYITTLAGLAGIMDLGLGVAVGRFIGMALGRSDHEAVRSYWATGHWIALPLMVLMSAAFFAACAQFGSAWFKLDAESSRTFYLCLGPSAVGLFAAFYGQFWLILLQMHHDYRFLAVVRSGFTISQLLLSISIAVLTGSLVLLLWVSTSVMALQTATMVWHARRTYGLDFDWKAARWSRAIEMKDYALKTFANLLAGAVFGSLDRLMLGRLAPSAAFLHFSICNNLGQRLLQASLAVMAPIFSNTSRAVGANCKATVSSAYEESFQFVIAWFCLAFCLTAIWGEAFVRIWLGHDAGAAIAPLLVPVIGASCFAAIANVSSSQLAATGRQGIATAFTVAAGAGSAIGVVAGWKLGGLPGSAWGYFLGRIVMLGQDVYLGRVFGAKAWLAKGTWLQFSAQLALSAFFYLLALSVGSETGVRLCLGMLHAAVAALFIAAYQFKPHLLPHWLRLQRPVVPSTG